MHLVRHSGTESTRSPGLSASLSSGSTGHALTRRLPGRRCSEWTRCVPGTHGDHRPRRVASGSAVDTTRSLFWWNCAPAPGAEIPCPRSSAGSVSEPFPVADGWLVRGTRRRRADDRDKRRTSVGGTSSHGCPTPRSCCVRSCHLHRRASRRRGDRAVRVGPAGRRTPSSGNPRSPPGTGLLPAGGAGAALVPRRHSAGPAGCRPPNRPLDDLPVLARGIDALAAAAPGCMAHCWPPAPRAMRT